jgi:hypothetical protein
MKLKNILSETYNPKLQHLLRACSQFNQKHLHPSNIVPNSFVIAITKHSIKDKRPLFTDKEKLITLCRTTVLL